MKICIENIPKFDRKIPFISERSRGIKNPFSSNMIVNLTKLPENTINFLWILSVWFKNAYTVKGIVEWWSTPHHRWV